LRNIIHTKTIIVNIEIGVTVKQMFFKAESGSQFFKMEW